MTDNTKLKPRLQYSSQMGCTIPSEKNGGRNTASIFGRSITAFPIWAIVYITKSDNRMLI